MKYFYLFGLFLILANRLTIDNVMKQRGEKELNSEQGIFIDYSIINTQDQEKAAIKLYSLGTGTAYYLDTTEGEGLPIPANNQFIIPVHKHGRAGLEPVPRYDNESGSCYS